LIYLQLIMAATSRDNTLHQVFNQQPFPVILPFPFQLDLTRVNCNHQPVDIQAA